jgi:hypothetical protein
LDGFGEELWFRNIGRLAVFRGPTAGIVEMRFRSWVAAFIDSRRQ